MLFTYLWVNHEIKRRLLLGRKVMTNLDSILKSRDITLSTKVPLVKAMVFWELDCEESWAPKNWCFLLWCWRRLLSRVQLFATLWTVTCQVPLSIGFYKQEYWCGLPCPSPGDLPDPGIEPISHVSGGWVSNSRVSFWVIALCRVNNSFG